MSTFFEARASVRVSLALKFADVAQLAERESSKLEAAGSIPVFRSMFRCASSSVTTTNIIVILRM